MNKRSPATLNADQAIMQIIEAECAALVMQDLRVDSCFSKKVCKMWIDKIVQNDNSSVFNRLLDLGYNAERHFYKTLLASQACAIVFLRRNPKYLDAFRAHVNLSNHAHAWAIQELNLMAGKQIPQNQTNTTDDCRNLFHT